MKIFLGLVEISGYYKNLKEGFRQRGVEADFFNLHYHPFSYKGHDNQNIFFRLLFWLKKTELNSVPPFKFFFRVVHALYLKLVKFFLFGYCLIKYDVFVFGFNSTFLNYLDLPILKLFNKKIIYQFNGSDARPPYMDGSIMASDRGLSITDCALVAKKKKKIIKKIDRYADHVINIPTTSQFHERRFINWIKIGIPCKPPLVKQLDVADHKNGKPIRILHSPSHPEAKGSHRICEIIERLRMRGLLIDFQMISNQSNEKVLEAISNCDFVIDQMYADYGLPDFAIEAAWFGKPTVIGGYAARLWDDLLAGDVNPPSLYCVPDAMEASIERMIRDDDFRVSLGMRARDFVQSHWSPELVAGRFLQLINGDVPDSWMLDPARFDYMHGAGFSEEKLKQIMNRYIEKNGRETLCLQDKPKLENAIVNWALC